MILPESIRVSNCKWIDAEILTVEWCYTGIEPGNVIHIAHSIAVGDDVLDRWRTVGVGAGWSVEMRTDMAQNRGAPEDCVWPGSPVHMSLEFDPDGWQAHLTTNGDTERPTYTELPVVEARDLLACNTPITPWPLDHTFTGATGSFRSPMWHRCVIADIDGVLGKATLCLKTDWKEAIKADG